MFPFSACSVLVRHLHYKKWSENIWETPGGDIHANNSRVCSGETNLRNPQLDFLAVFWPCWLSLPASILLPSPRPGRAHRRPTRPLYWSLTEIPPGNTTLNPSHWLRQLSVTLSFHESWVLENYSMLYQNTVKWPLLVVQKDRTWRLKRKALIFTLHTLAMWLASELTC